MKVFDFEGLVKGEFLGDIQRPTFLGSTYHDPETKKFHHIEVGPLRISYHSSAGVGVGNNMRLVSPIYFGKQAVCFCMGEIYTGYTSEWEWVFVCTPEFFEANKTEILKYTKRTV